MHTAQAAEHPAQAREDRVHTEGCQASHRANTVSAEHRRGAEPAQWQSNDAQGRLEQYAVLWQEVPPLGVGGADQVSAAAPPGGAS